MKIFKSPLYGKIKEPESFDELISIFTEEQSQGFAPIRYWRGQGDIVWTINSSGCRRIMQIESKVFGNDYDKHLFEYEQQLIEHATHKGYRYQNGRELYDLELLANFNIMGLLQDWLIFLRML